MNSTTLTLTNDTGPPPAKKKTLGSILKKNKEAMLPKTPQDRVKAEIDAYLSLPVVDSESDPLDWWRTQYKQLPDISTIGQEVPLYMCKQCNIRKVVQYLWKHCNPQQKLFKTR